MIKIAIIMCCYNRADLTEKCILSLLKQNNISNYELCFYICDDASTDDTIKRIKKIVPSALIVKSNGDLYWAKSMYVAMKKAKEKNHAFYLMINDDVEFYPDMLDVMVNSYNKIGEPCGIVGSTCDAEKSYVTYGGRIFTRKIKLGKNRIIEPNGNPQVCDLANWNCFLIPQEVIVNVGLIDRSYAHGLADYDYSRMMSSKGYCIYVADKYIGIAKKNSLSGTFMDPNTKLEKRLQHLFSKKGSPIKSEWLFWTKNYGLIGLLFFIYSYAKRILLCILKPEKLT